MSQEQEERYTVERVVKRANEWVNARADKIEHAMKEHNLSMAEAVMYVDAREIKTPETPIAAPETREMLERDVDWWLGSWTAFSAPIRTIKEAVLGWLDRAADIREREFVQQYCAECETAENAALKGDIAVLRDRLDNLAAERDEKAGLLETAFRRCKELEAENDALLAAHADDAERLDSMGEGELLDQIGMMTEEISELLKKQPYTFDVHDVRGSIRLVGRYIDELADELAKRDKGIERLKARRDELQAELEKQTADYADVIAAQIEQLREISKRKAELQSECDYWKQEVQHCMDAAYPPSHAPERPYNPHVMDYPPSGAYTTPSTMVSAVIDGLRDEKMDEWKGVFEQMSKAEAERERYRKLSSDLLDAAHNMQLIADRGLA